MCCGNKKKPQPPPPQTNVPKQQTQNPPPVQQQVQPNSAGTLPVGSQLGKSKISLDKSVVKSAIKYDEEPVNPNDSINQLFGNNCKVQKINLAKVTHQHASYVRQPDYFDLSNGHQNQLNNLPLNQDPQNAMYKISDNNTLTTPSINKFYYDRNVVDVGYVPTNEAYRIQYGPNYKRGKVINNDTTNQQYSTVKPYDRQNNNQNYQHMENNGAQPVGYYNTYNTGGEGHDYN